MSFTNLQYFLLFVDHVRFKNYLNLFFIDGSDHEAKRSKNFKISDVCDFDSNSISNCIQASSSGMPSPQLRWPLPPINGSNSKGIWSIKSS